MFIVGLASFRLINRLAFLRRESVINPDLELRGRAGGSIIRTEIEQMVLAIIIDIEIVYIRPYCDVITGSSTHVRYALRRLLDLEITHRLVHLPVQNGISRQHIRIETLLVIRQVEFANHL